MIESPVSLDVFGLKITPLSLNQLLDLIDREILAQRKAVILNQNLHGAYIFYRDEKFRELHLRSYVHIDGMAIVWLCRLRGFRVNKHHRLTYLDLATPLLTRAAESGWRVYFLGGKRNVLEVGITRLRAAIPGLVIEGHHGYFDAAPTGSDNLTIVERINEFRPAILIVGMGMPRQEHWVADNVHRVNANCILVSGAYIEYVASELMAPPRWLGPIGFEWLHRLVTNPRRYWRRYLVEPWVVMWLVCKQAIRRSGRGVRRGR